MPMSTPILPVPVLPHVWVKWSVQEVAVIVDPFTGRSTAVDVPGATVGEQVGCQCCGEPLTDSVVKLPCGGDTEQ